MSKNNLISISAFRREYFKEGSAPGQSTVRRWIQNGSIAGRIISGSERPVFYVDADAWEHSTGDEAVDDFLSNMGNSHAA